MTSVRVQASNIECHGCGYVFSYVDNLKGHMINVLREGSSKFICQTCQKSFSRSYYFIQHLVSYSGVEESRVVEAKCQKPSASDNDSADVK